jgi:AmiR/NasT family two-component response regulator
VQAYLIKPLREAELGPAIELATARFAEWQALRREAASWQEALAARDLVTRAKRVLMERENLSEQKAFHEIQHRARSRRCTMLEIAQDLIAGT